MTTVNNNNPTGKAVFNQIKRTENTAPAENQAEPAKNADTISADNLVKLGAETLGVSGDELKGLIEKNNFGDEIDADEMDKLFDQLPSQPSTTDETHFTSDHTLKKNSGDHEGVKQLQETLSEVKGPDGKPYFESDKGIDGKFGGDTEAAVKKFQQDHGLTPDGKVGPKTREALNAAYAAQKKVDEAAGNGTSDPQAVETPDPGQQKLDEMIADPKSAEDLTPKEQQQVEDAAEDKADEAHQEVNDPNTSIVDANQEADKAKDDIDTTKDAAEDAGQQEISDHLTDEQRRAEADKQKAADRLTPEAFQQQVRDAGNDPAKLAALADQLPASDPRGKALKAASDPAVSPEVRQSLVDALGKDGARSELSDALQAASANGASDADLKAISEAIRCKQSMQPTDATRKEMGALADAVEALQQASPAVRKELALGFDRNGNVGDFERALDNVTSKEDLAAIRAFAAHKELMGDPQFKDQHFSTRLDAMIKDFDTLRSNASVWDAAKKSFQDNWGWDSVGGDIRDGVNAATTKEQMYALARLAYASEEAGLATELTDRANKM